MVDRYKSSKYKEDNFIYILEKYKYNLHPGDIVAGTIKYIEKNGFLVNIGNQTLAYLPKEETNMNFTYFANENRYNSNILINLTREFFIITYNIYLKQYIISLKRLDYIKSWKRIKQLKKESIIYNVTINKMNRGGLITYLEHIQAFIPKSHILLNQNLSIVNKRNVKCKLLIVNEKQNQLILSQKSALLDLSKHKFKIGELIYGQIVQIKKYGIFIKIYNIISLLHISEIAFKYIKNIKTMFSLGKLIKIKIIYIDRRQGRISVSMRSIY
uniref:Ribosomal protein S1 n=1 Tax=Halydictyon mirabile TaxID=189652 RepID=A0A4D6WW95_9FLOR|nr:ribosomal protein S1 [Halydictyon mirabile]